MVDPLAYHWQHTTWQGRPWHEAVIYELHVGVLGGYAGVEQHLPRLAELGVTAIELMPLAQFPGERNWGYDGVLPYAPQASYGSPEQLKHLIDTAHGHGLAVILDVVYNHFGPDGNYLHQLRQGLLSRRRAHALGRGHRLSPARGAGLLHRQRPDVAAGVPLRRPAPGRGARHRRPGFSAGTGPAGAPAESTRSRHVWLMLENELNQASLLEQGFDAQWNDDGHNALHVLLTGETDAYYADFAQHPTEQLARCLSQGFVYQGHTTRHGHPRGEPSGHLPPSAFVLFLQNHDQIGNRAFGERLHQLARPRRCRPPPCCCCCRR